MRTLALALMASLGIVPALGAQGPSPANRPAPHPLAPDAWGVVYDVPATKQVRMQPDVPYARHGDRTLTLDIYLPPEMKRGERRPVVVFANAIGDRGADRVKRWAIYSSWPRLVAAHGMVGVSMDADARDVQGSLRELFRFIEQRGAAHGIDGTRIGVYGASANVTGLTQYLASDGVAPGIRASVLYYGNVPTTRLRGDLPTLFVVAQSDAPQLRPRLDSLWQRVVDSAAPWTLLFARGEPHAFDAVQDDDGARAIIRQTIAFWQANLLPTSSPDGTPRSERAIVASMYAHDPARTLTLIEPYLREHPRDAVGLRLRAFSLAQLGRSAEADSGYRAVLAIDSLDTQALSGLGQLRIAARDWPAAERYVSALVRLGFEDSRTVGMLAWAQLNAGKNAEAARNYERAFELGIPPGRNTAGLAAYNLACAYARLGRVGDALTMLERAVENGLVDRATYENDEDLKGLRGEERFRGLMERLPEG